MRIISPQTMTNRRKCARGYTCDVKQYIHISSHILINVLYIRTVPGYVTLYITLWCIYAHNYLWGDTGAIDVLYIDNEMNGYWAGDNLGLWNEFCLEPWCRIDYSTYWSAVQHANTVLRKQPAIYSQMRHKAIHMGPSFILSWRISYIARKNI